MTRDEVATQTGLRLSAVLSEVGLAAEDTTGNLKEPIDDSLRAAGYAESALPDAESEDVVGWLALARYHTLKLAEARAVSNFDLSTGGDSFKLNQVYTNIQALLKRAEADVIDLFGTTVGGGANGDGSGGIVLMHMDFLDPSPAEVMERYG